MTATHRLLERAARHVETFPGLPEAGAPSQGVAVLACMDARLDPAAILGLAPGEAHVIRNAGGIVTDDAIRSLAISQHLMGTREVMLMHHTGCGMLSVTDEEVHARLRSHAGAAPAWSAGTFSDLDDAVRTAIARVAGSPYLLHRDAVRGFVYDLADGRLREITPA